MRRWAPLVVAVAVSLPAVGTGFVLDDWLQRGVVRGAIDITTPTSLFNFGPGDAAVLDETIRRGPFPWFTFPELKLRFWRPLSSALIVVDTTLFGDAAWPQHLHSTLWYVALCAVALSLYRRLVPSLALAAGLLFAIDDAHTMPTSWLANRNALVAALFVWVGLSAHLAWRERGWRAGAWLSPLAYSVGLAAGETAVAALAYVAAYELFGRPGTLGSKARGFVPVGVVLATYAVVYKWSNAGARGSATYIDPVTEPLLFLSAAPGRLLANVGSATFALPDFWLVLPQLRWLLVVAGVAGVAAGLAAWRRWAPSDVEERRTVLWLFIGGLGALVPTLATFPAARLLTAPSLGFAPLVAVLLRGALADVGLRRALGLVWLGGAFVVQPLTQWLSIPLTFHAASRLAQEGLSGLDVKSTDRVVIVASTDFILAVYGVPLLLEQHRPVPATWHVWSMAPHATRLSRISERQLELEVEGGQMVDSVFEENFRSAAYPFVAGDRVPLDGSTITVLAVDEGKPTRIGVELDRPADDFVFTWWTGAALERLTLPAVGESRRFPRTLPLLERLLPGRGDRLE